MIKFDGVASPNLPQVGTASITATVPTTGATGFVDVSVTSGGKTSTAASIFEYWPDGTGKYGSYGVLGWNEYRGKYWYPGNYTPPAFFDGHAAFASPSNDPFWKVEYSDKMDSCSRDYSNNAGPLVPGASTMDLVSGSHTITLDQSPDDSSLYVGDASTVSAGDVLLGGVYDLQPMPGSDWPQFTAPNFGVIPVNDPDITNPKIDGTGFIAILESDFTFNWDGPYDGDYMLFDLLLTRSGSQYYLERVSCVATDDGTFKIPVGTFSEWNPAKQDQVIITAGRAVESKGTIPFNNSTTGVVGVHWEIGVVAAK